MQCQFGFLSWQKLLTRSIVVLAAFVVLPAHSVMIQFNSTGGTTATNGLHFYIDDSTQIQVRRLNNSGQVFENTAIPPSARLDNGVYIRANGLVYGPSHTVGNDYTPSGGLYSTRTLTAASPANPTVSGDQQTATGVIGITSGPQATIVWKYTTPLDFLTAEVTFTIPATYPVSAANPVRYYHVFDTFLGGSDQGCGVSFVDSNGKRVIGTYPPASGTTCPSSTAIPAGVSVVESFRERSGLTFSKYCASDYYSFFDTSTPNCSVRQSATMSNKVTTTYQDTGIGVEYDFTAPGTYTFSYDFVVGSPLVPTYDHLEIRHDGAGTLCPETVTVLACTSTTVPCPVANIVNTGTLTGSMTTTTPPTVVDTPSTFTLGSSASTTTVSLQSSGAGTVTLGTNGLSTVPTNGTKCWNTATSTQSCSMTFASTPCVSGFECLETGATYTNLVTTPAGRNPLHTKLTGTNFKFDVVALQSSGAIATSYTAASNVTVELFADTASPAPTCSAYASPVASQAITFVAGDSGRKTLSTDINLTAAYSKLRCRVRDNNISPVVYGCSSDNFAVRPQQLAVSAPVLTNTALTGTPTAVAGTAFVLDATATAVTAGYTGTPAIDTTKVQDHASVAIAIGTLTGNFSAGTGTKASGTGFKYTDVGNIKFLTDAVVDSGFTSVDQVGDCVAGSTSNALSGGKYGCNIGSSASATLGRWIPSHFSFSGALTPFCGAGGFTYMDQDALGVQLTLKAHAAGAGAASATDPVASRYGAGYTNLAPVTVSGDNNGTAVVTSRITSPVFPSMPNTALWAAGLFTVNDTFSFSKLASPDGPYDLFKLKAALTDPDGAVLIGTAAAQETATTRIRYGRVQLQNAYGSERLPLTLPMVLQYWNGSWQRNTLDTCTTFAASQFAWSFPAGTTGKPNNLSACESAVAVSGTPPNNTVLLSAPGVGNGGWADLVLNLGATAAGSACTVVGAGSSGAASTVNAPWLQHNWSGVVDNPKARATFGIYKSPLIYRRENY